MNLKRMLAGCAVATALVLAPMSAPSFADAPPAPTGVPAAVPLSSTPKIAKWQELQYGMFMHFGVYSVYGGYNNGHRQGMGYPEQIKAWENIPTDDYLLKAKDLAANFDASAAAAPTPDPDDQEAPVIKPLTVTANPAEDAQISGDGVFRTVTAKEGTQVTIKAEASGTPTPTLFWQIKREGSDSWAIVEEENGPELTLTIDGENNGSVIRVMAMNEAGVAESGLVTLALAEEPAPEPEPSPDPTPDPAPTPDPTPDPAPAPDHTVGTWMNDGAGWWWKISAGGYAKNETLTLGGNVYRFDQNGYMLTGWVYWDGAWRYHNGTGAQVTGWVNLGGSWFYLTPETGAMGIGWQMVGDRRFFFASNGVMTTGWLYTSGAWYYLDPSGAMHTGWLQMGSHWYLMSDSGAMTIGWVPLGNAWYYFGASGQMATGWQVIGGSWYYFGTGGDMYTGGHWIGWRWYTFGSDGRWLG